MDDKTIMSTILGNVKGECDLMLHGTIESASANVNNVFDAALQNTLAMKNEIYNLMTQKGWYPVQTAEQTEIEQAKQRFSGQ